MGNKKNNMTYLSVGYGPRNRRRSWRKHDVQSTSWLKKKKKKSEQQQQYYIIMLYRREKHVNNKPFE